MSTKCQRYMSTSVSTPGPSPSKRRKTDKDTKDPKNNSSQRWNTNKKYLRPSHAPIHIPALSPRYSNSKRPTEKTNNPSCYNDKIPTSISVRDSLKKLKFSNRIVQRDLNYPRAAFSPHSPRKLFNFAHIPR